MSDTRFVQEEHKTQEQKLREEAVCTRALLDALGDTPTFFLTDGLRAHLDRTLQALEELGNQTDSQSVSSETMAVADVQETEPMCLSCDAMEKAQTEIDIKVYDWLLTNPERTKLYWVCSLAGQRGPETSGEPVLTMRVRLDEIEDLYGFGSLPTGNIVSILGLPVKDQPKIEPGCRICRIFRITRNFNHIAGCSEYGVVVLRPDGVRVSCTVPGWFTKDGTQAIPIED